MGINKMKKKKKQQQQQIIVFVLVGITYFYRFILFEFFLFIVKLVSYTSCFINQNVGYRAWLKELVSFSYSWCRVQSLKAEERGKIHLKYDLFSCQAF